MESDVRVEARHGSAGHGEAWTGQGMARLGRARLGKDLARLGVAGRGWARTDDIPSCGKQT